MSASTYTPALIIIDVQNDFVSGSLAVPGGADIIGNINSLIALPGFKVKVASKDFHPPKHVSFAETHQKDLFSTLTLYHPHDEERKHGIQQVLWPVHCVQGTEGADFAPGLETSSFDTVIVKGVDPGVESYSAFQDVWGRESTELPAILKEKGITDVYLAGLATDYCVKWTAIHALEEGYKAWVVKDAVKSIRDETEAVQDLEGRGIKFVDTENLKQVLQDFNQ
ncbi:pyrazinamidase/nicotinamidase [Crepidotus variabilis]|uniref:nicotinamidase n=1 Tax=Crepidotus variabilis TaxID=179855 RepID=A0A9P6EMT7_9AGAR|nr:pyrazinamidase/nicotinamidase [Crepidotus variabilis]